VTENVRQETDVRAAAWAVRQGIIGSVQLALLGSLGGLWSPDRVVADTPWRHQRLLGGGGGSIDIGVHQMHWMRYVVGEPATISALVRTLEPVRHRTGAGGQARQQVAVDVDDTYLATLDFANGAAGQLWWSWALHGAPLDIPGAPVVFGSRGSIAAGEIMCDDGSRTSLVQTFEQGLAAEERERFFPLGLRDPFAIQNLDWLRAIEQGRDPETSGREGLRDLACAYAILESAALGRPVSVEEILSHTVDQYQRPIDAHYGLL
jgi:predicted dehydrogenase